MFGFYLTVVLSMMCLGGSAALSIPVPCQGFVCSEGTVCVVHPPVNCTGNCPVLVPSCDPVSSKVGECPDVIDVFNCQSLLEFAVCLTDQDCADDLKCCGGCCRTPDTSHLPSAQSEKPGSCLQFQGLEVEGLLRSFVCSETRGVKKCHSDADCPGIDKCCPGVCGLACKKVLSTVYIEKRLRGRTTEVAPTTHNPDDDLKKIPKPRRPLQSLPQIEPRPRVAENRKVPRPLPVRA